MPRQVLHRAISAAARTATRPAVAAPATPGTAAVSALSLTRPSTSLPRIPTIASPLRTLQPFPALRLSPLTALTPTRPSIALTPLSAALPLLQARFLGNEYQPSTRKRKRKFGFLQRLRDRLGRKTLAARKRKGRKYLSH